MLGEREKESTRQGAGRGRSPRRERSPRQKEHSNRRRGSLGLFSMLMAKVFIADQLGVYEF